MGVIKQGILGGFSGKVANIVGSSWKGIAVIKSRPLSVANPRTAGQVAQRTKFSSCVEMAKALLSTIVKPLWDRFAQLQSGYNAFISANIDAFNSSGVPTATQLVMSSGALLQTEDNAVTGSASGDTIDATWTSNSGTGNALATDELYLTVYDSEEGDFYGYATGAVRSDESYQVTGADYLQDGITISAYFSWRRADGTLVSTSERVALTPGV